MKIYKYYISDDHIFNNNFKPDLLFSSWEDCGFTEKAIELPYMKMNSGIYYYLYAITNNKELAKEFELTHNMDIFIRTINYINDAEYSKLENDYSACFIEKYSFKDKNNKSLNLITTEMETSILYNIEDGVETMLSQTAGEFSYEGFKDKYIEALDYLLYCTYNKMNSEENDYFSYNWGFGITAEGYVKNQVRYDVNIFDIYYNIFSHLLK